MQKRLRWRLDQQKRPRQPANHTGDHQRNHDPARNFQFLAISSAAKRRADPQRKRIRRIRGDRRDTRKKQRGKRDKAPAAGDRVDRSSESSGKKQKNRGMQVQA